MMRLRIKQLIEHHEQVIRQLSRGKALGDQHSPEGSRPMAKPSKRDQDLLARLAELGGQREQDDALTYQGDKVVLPAIYENKPMKKVIEFLEAYEASRVEPIAINRDFPYHPYDTANSFQRVLKEVFGTSGVVKREKFQFFGMEIDGPPPEMRTVKTSHTDTIQVPWGEVQLPLLEAKFQIGYVANKNKQPIGAIAVLLPKRFRAQVEGLFKAIEADLRAHSIYRGKAIDANWLEPEFLDLTVVDPDKVAYSADTRAQLNANVWSVVEHSAAIRLHGMSLKRAVLLEGPYGCGKSLTGMVTAQKAVAHNWTFVYCRPGQNLDQALHAAKLLAPSVVFFEDLDVVADPSEGDQNAEQISKLLDMFDGVANKRTPIVAVLTTNHVERIHKGMLRPGRLDAVVHIGQLDAEGVQTLVQSVLPENIRGEIDYTDVADAMAGFLPAFIKEATERALRFSLARGQGTVEKINTDDLIGAADSLRPQLDLMEGAGERVSGDPLSIAMSATISEAVAGTEVIDPSDDDYVSGVLRKPIQVNGLH